MLETLGARRTIKEFTMEEYCTLPLRGKYGANRTIKISLEDFEEFSKFNWICIHNPNRKKYYAVKSVYIGNQKSINVLMHRTIINAPKGVIVDHKNGDGLDNRRCNLRLCTTAENIRNAGSRGGSSKYKGVWYDKKRSLWRARIKVSYKEVYLGRFSTELEAAQAYDEAALMHHKEFAKLNLS